MQGYKYLLSPFHLAIHSDYKNVTNKELLSLLLLCSTKQWQSISCRQQVYKMVVSFKDCILRMRNK